jgi:hypothetical protein
MARRFIVRVRAQTLDQIRVPWSSTQWESSLFLHHLQSRKTPVFYFSADSRTVGEFCNLFPDAYRSLTLTANRICDGFIPFWCMGEQKVGKKVEWNRDPLTQVEWPVLFQGDIDYRDSDRIGDIRTVWELNRHQWMVPLAQAFFVSGDARYFDHLEYLIYSWVEANPVDVGCNWISSMELALRVQSWIWIAYYAGGLDSGSQLSDCLIKGIFQHTHHIEKNLARFSSANNHLLVEASTLSIVGMLFPEFKCRLRWQRKGLGLLDEGLEKQINSDGVSAEQAVHYHAFVLEAVLLVVILAERNQVPIPRKIRNTAHKMAAFLGALTDLYGNVPSLGDSDNGVIVRLGGNEENHARTLRTISSVVFQKLPLKIASDSFTEAAYWLLGREGKELFDTVPVRTQGKALEVYPDGGYAIVQAETERKKDNARLTFSAGPHGFGELCAHAHADALSVTASVNGVDILIDPGTYCYNIEREWRDYFRSTDAHNTVTVDDRNQSQILGSFLWGKRTDAVLASHRSERWCQFVCGYHDGYSPVRHHRYVMYLEIGLCLIVDRLVGDETIRKYDLCFQLDKHIKPVICDDKIEMWYGGKVLTKMWLTSSSDLDVSITHSQASDHFLEKHPTQRIVGTREGQGEVIFISLLSIGDIDLDIVKKKNGFVHFKTSGLDHFVSVNSAQTNMLDFCGDYLYLLCEGDMNLQKAFVYQGEKFSFLGQDLIGSLKNKEEYWVMG